jgi:Ca2+-binding RTX toxin-like protein
MPFVWGWRGGNDTLYAIEDDKAQDLIYGGTGDDKLYGGTGHDKLFGEDGNDELYASDDGGELDGGEGNDTLYGSLMTGDDILKGGAGQDNLYGSQGHDSLTGGADADRFYFYSANLKTASTLNTIEDASAEDRAYIDSVGPHTLTFVKLNTPNQQWISADGRIKVTHTPGFGLIIQSVENGQISAGEILVKNFENGVLGLTLSDGENHAPEVQESISNQQATQDEAFTYTFPANLFTDPDGDVLNYSVSQTNSFTLPGWLNYNATTRTLSGTPGNDDVGSLNLKVTATDPKGLSVTQTFTLEVANINDAPEVSHSLPDLTGTQNDLFVYTLPESQFTDPDGDELTYAVTLADGSALPSWLSFDAATRTLSGTPDNDDVGSLNLKVTATDPEGLFASQTFGLEIQAVLPTNHAPEATGSILAQNGKEGETFSLTLPESLFVDPDGDELAYAVTLADGASLPSWLTFDPVTRALSGTPGAGDAGNLNLKVTASDGSLAASLGFALSVTTAIVYNPITGTASSNLLSGTARDDYIQGLAGNDTLLGYAGNDWLEGNAGNDTLYGGTGNDRLEGHEGNDTLHGEAGDDTLRGGIGNDTLYGNAGNDTLEGNAGADRLEGGAGDDTYILRKGDGEDIINNYDTASASLDTVRFEDIASNELTGLFRDGSDLILTYGDADRLTFDNFYLSASYRVDRFAFTDATLTTEELLKRYPVQLSSSADVLTFTDLGDIVDGLAGNDILYGSGGDDLLSGNLGNDTLYGGADDDTLQGDEGNDTLRGEAGNDILQGGTGADRLEGGAGDDTYILRKGDGEDILNNYDTASTSIDTVRFEDIASDELTGLFRSGGDLILTYGDTDKLTLDNFYLSASYRVDRFAFTDATLTTGELLKLYPVQISNSIDVLTFTELDDVVDGLAGNDLLYGSDGDDILSGNLGNDILHGGNDNDRLEGGDGNDTLYGEAGNDTLAGNAGNDRLEGGRGDDIYLFGRGDGQDVIYDYDTTQGNADTLAFGEGIAAVQLWFRKSGSNLEVSVLGGTSGDKVTINNWYTGSSGAYRVEAFQTADALLTQERVQTLVDAMSGYAQPQDNPPDALLQIIGSSWEIL